MFIVDRREEAGRGKSPGAEHGQQNKPDHERTEWEGEQERSSRPSGAGQET